MSFNPAQIPSVTAAQIVALFPGANTQLSTVYLTASDGSQSAFDWEAGNTSTADSLTVFNPTGNAGNGRWVKRGVNPSIVTCESSAYGPLSTAITGLPATGGDIAFVGGDYTVQAPTNTATPPLVGSRINIKGWNSPRVILKETVADPAGTTVSFENLRFTGHDNQISGITWEFQNLKNFNLGSIYSNSRLLFTGNTVLGNLRASQYIDIPATHNIFRGQNDQSLNGLIISNGFFDQISLLKTHPNTSIAQHKNIIHSALLITDSTQPINQNVNSETVGASSGSDIQMVNTGIIDEAPNFGRYGIDVAEGSRNQTTAYMGVDKGGKYLHTEHRANHVGMGDSQGHNCDSYTRLVMSAYGVYTRGAILTQANTLAKGKVITPYIRVTLSTSTIAGIVCSNNSLVTQAVSGATGYVATANANSNAGTSFTSVMTLIGVTGTWLTGASYTVTSSVASDLCNTQAPVYATAAVAEPEVGFTSGIFNKTDTLTSSVGTDTGGLTITLFDSPPESGQWVQIIQGVMNLALKDTELSQRRWAGEYRPVINVGLGATGAEAPLQIEVDNVSLKMANNRAALQSNGSLGSYGRMNNSTMVPAGTFSFATNNVDTASGTILRYRNDLVITDALQYRLTTSENTAIGGLTDGRTYYPIPCVNMPLNTDTPAATLTFTAGATITQATTGAQGTVLLTHKITAGNGLSSFTVLVVYPTNGIAFDTDPTHNYVLTSSNGGDTTGKYPTTQATDYFRLATSLANAIAGTYVTLTSTPSNQSHIFMPDVTYDGCSVRGAGHFDYCGNTQIGGRDGFGLGWTSNFTGTFPLADGTIIPNAVTSMAQSLNCNNNNARWYNGIAFQLYGPSPATAAAGSAVSSGCGQFKNNMASCGNVALEISGFANPCDHMNFDGFVSDNNTVDIAYGGRSPKIKNFHFIRDTVPVIKPNLITLTLNSAESWAANTIVTQATTGATGLTTVLGSSSASMQIRPLNYIAFDTTASHYVLTGTGLSGATYPTASAAVTTYPLMFQSWERSFHLSTNGGGNQYFDIFNVPIRCAGRLTVTAGSGTSSVLVTSCTIQAPITTLTLSGNETLTQGGVITQATSGATGTVLTGTTASNTVDLQPTNSITFDTTHTISGAGASGATNPTAVSYKPVIVYDAPDVLAPGGNWSWAANRLQFDSSSAPNTLQLGIHTASVLDAWARVEFLGDWMCTR